MFEQVKQEIDDKIKTNDSNEITATRLNGVLQDMMDASAEVIEEVQRSIGDQVEANPTGTATTPLNKIKIGETIYKTDNPFAGEVVATDAERLQALANVSNQSPNTPFDGKMGYLVLKPQVNDDLTSSFAAQIQGKENYIFEIKDVFDLDGADVEIPSGCKFKFNGGAITNGFLMGNFETINGSVDAAWIGCVYGDDSDEYYNYEALKVLSKLDNMVTLTLSNDIVVSSKPDVGFDSNSFNSIQVDGGGNTMTVKHSGSGVFNVSKRFEAHNLNVVFAVGATTFTTMVDGGGVSTFKMTDCRFNGNIKACVFDKKAEATLANYYDEITIDGCTFENFNVLSSDQWIFDLRNVNFQRLNITNNIVHNFHSMFLAAEISNNSTHQTAIRNFADTIGRISFVENNDVFCDTTFHPWEAENYTPVAYRCFVALEEGDCYYRNNRVVGLLEYNNSVTCVDAYLSVYNLVYENNYWKNNLNLYNSHNNEFLKSKGGKDGGNRYYRNNTFITTDLSSDFGTIANFGQGISLFDLQGNSKNEVVISSNLFDIYYYKGNRSVQNYMKSAEFCSNDVIVNTDVDTPTNGILFVVGGVSLQKVTVCNNVYNLHGVISTGSYPSSLLHIYRTGEQSVDIDVLNISGNTVKNACIISQQESTINAKVSKIDSNNSIFDSDNPKYQVSHYTFVGTNYFGNLIKTNSTQSLFGICKGDVCYYVITTYGSLKVFTNISQIFEYQSTIVTLTDIDNGGSAVFEFISKDESDTKHYYFIDNTYTKQNETSVNNVSPKNFGDLSSLVFTNFRLQTLTTNKKYRLDVKTTKVSSTNDFQLGVSIITKSAEHVTFTNNTGFVKKGSSYYTEVTAEYGYTIDDVTVLVGGNDVTNFVYNNGIIFIPNVTGNIAITATAIQNT